MGERSSGDPPLFFTTHVFVCGNRRPDGHPRGSCAEKGSEKIRDYMKARVKELGLATPGRPSIRINASGCLDRCELGPCAVIYPEGVWYRLDDFKAVDEVLERHVIEGLRATALMLPDG